MRPINEKLRADLLEAGKREFLAVGYQRASLRNIAASLGVTTGAIYRYYSDKEALFDELVEKPAKELLDRYRAAQQAFAAQPVEDQVSNLPEVPESETSWMFDHIYDNFDAFKLITCSAAGTKYEHYLDTLAEIEDNASRLLIERMTKAGYSLPQIDDALIHIMSRALFNRMFETVRHDMPRDKAKGYIQSLRDFYSAGWFKLLGISGN